MASNLLKIHPKTLKTSNPPTAFPFPTHHHRHFPHISLPSPLLHKPKTTSISPLCSRSSPTTPPTSKEAAIQQAKTCLSTTLEKPLNNLRLTTTKLKKPKQPRFRLEIPVIDDSPGPLSELALQIFQDLPIKRKGPKVNILIIWPSIAYKNAALKAFGSNPSTPVGHLDISSITNGNTRISNSADVAVFLAPEGSQLGSVKEVVDLLYPRPVVIFNPKWAFEDEEEFGGELSGFVGSFEVIFSFMGLEVKGLLNKRNGVIFKCVRNGVVGGEKWAVFVEEEGELKVVSSFKSRPSIGEVETVLYNLMAINSPVTKSVKFFRDLVSNVTGKK